MTFGVSVAVLALVIVVFGAVFVFFTRPNTARRKSRKRRTEEPIDPLSDPPTITHYGHG